MTPAQAAEITGLSLSAIQRGIARMQLRVSRSRVNGYVRLDIDGDDLVAWDCARLRRSADRPWRAARSYWARAAMKGDTMKTTIAAQGADR